LSYYAASIGIMRHCVVLTVGEATSVLRLNRCIQGIWCQCTLSACNARLHASSDNSSNMYPERSQLDSKGITERVQRSLGRVVNGSKYVGNDLLPISIHLFNHCKRNKALTNPSH
jgi:hypothetical protein